MRRRIALFAAALVAAFLLFATAVSANVDCYDTEREPLLGNWQYSGSELISPPSVWGACCSAWTPQVAFFPFNEQPYVRFYKVWWYLTWTPSSNGIWAKLVSSPSYTDNIAQVQAAPTGGPVPLIIDVTSAFQAMRQAGVSKNIGIMFWGDGVSTARVYDSHLRIVKIVSCTP